MAQIQSANDFPLNTAAAMNTPAKIGAFKLNTVSAGTLTKPYSLLTNSVYLF
jgi:hypothetical protein